MTGSGAERACIDWPRAGGIKQRFNQIAASNAFFIEFDPM
jgi:hypothetical protein